MPEQDNSSFVGWQEKRIEHFGFVNNLFIALASGFLILEAQSFLGEAVFQVTEALFIGGTTVLMFASLMVGCALAINRLLSFRNTAKIARKRETKQRDGIENLRTLTDAIDERSWNMLWWQTGLFILGSTLFVVLIILEIITKTVAQ